MGLQLPAGLPCLQGAGAAGAGRRVSRSWPRPAHLQTAACFLPLRFLFGVSFRGQPWLIRSRAGSPLPRAGGRRVQEATANTALPLHRKQVGLVGPAPHRGSPRLEGGSVQTRKATSSGSRVGSHLPSQACHEVGSSGCQKPEWWHSKDEIWVI